MDTGCLLGTSAMKVIVVRTELIPAFKADLRQEYSHPDLFTSFLSKYIVETGVGEKTQWSRDGRTS